VRKRWIVAGLIACIGFSAVLGFTGGILYNQPRILRLESNISQLHLNLTHALSNLTELQMWLSQAIGNITKLERELANAKAQLIPGRLQPWYVGDCWISSVLHNGTVYTFTVNITGEEMFDGKPCYVEELTSEPQFLDMIKMKAWKDKSIMKEIKSMWISQNYTYVELSTHTFVGEVIWPKRVGKRVNFTRTVKPYVVVGNETTPYDSYTENYTLMIVKMENVTVPAGTFECFKLEVYENGELKWIEWYSDQVKVVVKYEYYALGATVFTPPTTVNLLSYSIRNSP